MKFLSLTLGLLSTTLLSASNSAIASSSQLMSTSSVKNVCDRPPGFDREAERRPSSQERTFRSRQYGLSFKLPSNYNVVARSGNLWGILPNGQFALEQCRRANNDASVSDCDALGWVFSWCDSIKIKVINLSASERRRTLRDVTRPYVDDEGMTGGDRGISRVNGLQVWTQTRWVSSYDKVILSFVSPSRKYLILIAYSDRGEANEGSDPIDIAIVNRIVSTFQFQ
jgi:hypothetical protein